MLLAHLRALMVECQTNPNYQYRNSTPAEMLAMAKSSFNNLTELQRTKVQKSWTAALQSNGEELTTATAEELVLSRFMAQTNLYFLCHLLETYNQVVVGTHEEICNKFFVQKNPNFATFEKFAKQYTDKKDRMLLVPRGGFKSSIDIADCVQWIISFPAITILILTGVYSLAGDFVGEVRGHFTNDDSMQEVDTKTGKAKLIPKLMRDRETGDWSPSFFQVLFPEHCISVNDGKMSEFQTPAISTAKEPSVRAASIEQALVGAHFEVLKLDDVVTNENSQTIDRLKKINKQISIDRAMLQPFGFMDVIGTWYDEKDFYGEKIKVEEALIKEDGGEIVGTVDSGRFELTGKYKIYLRSALWLTPEAIKAGKTDVDAKAEDYELWFPERLPFSFLNSERKTDPEGFAIKYLNNPRKIHRIKFERALLMARTIPHNQLPPQGIVVTTIDTAYSTKSWADYTVILTSFIAGGRFFILNMVRGRFNEYELPKVIAATAQKWKPKRVSIEDSPGVKWMGKELRREMDKLQISVPVEYVSLGQGSKSKSKQFKAKPVMRLLGDSRMYFMNSCEGLQEIYNEMEQFTGTGEEPHDDIVCALSLLAEQYGAYADMAAITDQVASNYVTDAQAHDQYQKVYGLGKYAHLNASHNLGDHPNTAFQMENDRKFQTSSGSEHDPLSDLF